jgi:hypothetical protein
MKSKFILDIQKSCKNIFVNVKFYITEYYINEKQKTYTAQNIWKKQ